MSGSFLLSHSPSLPQACLSGCFLCQPGCAPASPLLGGQQPSSPARAPVGCGFPECPLMPLPQRRGLQGTASGWGHISSSFLHCLNPHLLGNEARSQLPPALHGAVGPPRSGPRFPGGGEPTANAAPWHSVHLVVLLCFFAKDLYFWHEGIGELPPQLGSGLECRIGIAFPLPLPPILHITRWGLSLTPSLSALLGRGSQGEADPCPVGLTDFSLGFRSPAPCTLPGAGSREQPGQWRGV